MGMYVICFIVCKDKKMCVILHTFMLFEQKFIQNHENSTDNPYDEMVIDSGIYQTIKHKEWFYRTAKYPIRQQFVFNKDIFLL